MRVSNDRDLILRVKLLLPERVWRLVTKPAAKLLRMMPESLKYRLGLNRRKARLPYSSIKTDDHVFQIGAPRDLLAVGRSRSAYFLNLVSGSGKLIVMEPDSENCEALLKYAERNGLADRLLVVNAGGWSEEKQLSFFQSAEHPASAVLAELSEASPDEMKRRGYNEIVIPVTTVDNVIKKHGLPVPRLISITTNGAELPIMDGMAELLKTGPQYISLAITGDKYHAAMKKFGYDYVADDDRGFTFKRAAK